MTRSCFMETSELIAVTINVSRERRSASSVTANASCSRAVKPSPLPPSSLRHFLSKGVNHSAAASRGPISMRACRYSSASRSASRSSAGRTWAMVPVISIGPFRGFLFGHHPPVMPAGAATEGVDRDDPTRMPDGTLVGPSGMWGRNRRAPPDDHSHAQVRECNRLASLWHGTSQLARLSSSMACLKSAIIRVSSRTLCSVILTMSSKLSVCVPSA